MRQSNLFPPSLSMMRSNIIVSHLLLEKRELSKNIGFTPTLQRPAQQPYVPYVYVSVVLVFFSKKMLYA